MLSSVIRVRVWNVADLESIQIYFIQGAVDIWGSVGHSRSTRMQSHFLIAKQSYPQQSRFPWQQTLPETRVGQRVLHQCVSKDEFGVSHTKRILAVDSQEGNSSFPIDEYQETLATHNRLKNVANDGKTEWREVFWKGSPKHPPPFENQRRVQANKTLVLNLISSSVRCLATRAKAVERVHLVHPRCRLNHPHHQALSDSLIGSHYQHTHLPNTAAMFYFFPLFSPSCEAVTR